MSEQNDNIWAPWRMEYIQTLEHEPDANGCFLCRYWESPEHDAEHHVVWRTPRAFVVMNRFPYTNGHLLVSSAAHVPGLDSLEEPDLIEITKVIRDATRLLKETIRPHGFNIGFNISRCAGAGLPDHVHAHIVPRWDGDTNSMAVVGDVRVIPQSIDALHRDLTENAKRLGLGN